jgi:hypothetical protein
MPRQKSKRATARAASKQPNPEIIAWAARRATTLALELIKPNPEQAAQAREDVVAAIAAVREGEAPLNLAEQELRELRKLASSLPKMIAALHFPQWWVLARGSLTLWDRVCNLRKELGALAEAVETRRRAIGKFRKPRANVKKVVAAFCAHRLLCTYGVKPTLSDGGAFFQLTAVLYEGGTGIKPGSADADVAPVCRKVFHGGDW